MFPRKTTILLSALSGLKKPKALPTGFAAIAGDGGVGAGQAQFSHITFIHRLVSNSIFGAEGRIDNI